jgi:nitroreductase
MNETIRQLFARKSCRAYTGEEITEDEERQILEAACQAPTAGNQQLYTIIAVRDQAVLDRLAVSCDNQPFIARANLALVFCADPARWRRAFVDAGCEPRPIGVGDLALALCDAAIAAQNAVVAAESLGIGSCYIGDILERCEEQREILGTPEGVVPCVMLVLGRPTEQQLARTKPPRFALDAVVCRDRYHEQPIEELRDEIARKEGASGEDGHAGPDYERRVKAFCERKWNSGFSREMTRSVAAVLASYASDVSDSGEQGE